MRDPYEVLGVSRDASDEDVKRAYRTLAKKYHPDLNPGNKEAERRMKEINDAYDRIKSGNTDPIGGAYGQQRAYGGSYGGSNGGRTGDGGFGYGPFGGFYGGFQQQERQESNELRAARNYINAGHYQEALHVLSTVEKRDAEWYYLSALANAGMGNRVAAMEQARRAAQMDPDDLQYQQLIWQLENSGRVYQQYGRGFGMDIGGAGRICASLCVPWALCFCCRGC